MDEDTRKAILYLAEQLDAQTRPKDEPPQPVCAGCGHARYFHLANRLYQACMFPKADIRLCRCLDFTPLTED